MLPVGTVVTSDLDGGDPLTTAFTLGAADQKTNVDYSVAGSASLSGTMSTVIRSPMPVRMLVLGAALAVASLLRQEQLAASAPVAKATRWTPSRSRLSGAPTADHPVLRGR